jgi:hypothetical protein
MVMVFVRHAVSDFAKWKQAYDDFGPTQKRLGVTKEAVYHGVDDANDVTVMHEFDSVEAAQQFLDSDEVRSTMESAGVAGEPTIWFTNEA